MKFLLMRRKFIVMDYRPTVQWYAHTRYEIRRSSQLSHLKRSGNIVIAERDYTGTVRRLWCHCRRCRTNAKTNRVLLRDCNLQHKPNQRLRCTHIPNQRQTLAHVE